MSELFGIERVIADAAFELEPIGAAEKSCDIINMRERQTMLAWTLPRSHIAAATPRIDRWD